MPFTKRAILNTGPIILDIFEWMFMLKSHTTVKIWILKILQKMLTCQQSTPAWKGKISQRPRSIHL